QELMDEEDVSLYEIREEFAETETMMQSGPIEEDDVFKIEASPGDLIDEFMGAEDMAGSAMAADQEEELTEAEILDAVEEPSVEQESQAYGAADESPWETESLAEAEDVEKAGELENLSVEESTGLSWGAGTAAGAGLAAAAPRVQETAGASATEPGSTATAAVDEETVRRIVAEMVEVKATEIIERIAWEVIPDLAEVLIKQEIQRIQQEVESS
ncbi:MAG: hypothetical protein R3231_08390, partial [bacterium]|nr:hypothetical protein [bacterium]